MSRVFKKTNRESFMKKALYDSLLISIVLGLIWTVSIMPAFAKENKNYGGIFKIAYHKPAMNFGNPAGIRGPDEFYAQISLQRLLQPGDKPGVFEPLLATKWELSSDSSSYTFHLRKGVKFHDGTPFNAQAVKWNLDRVRSDSKVKKGKPGKKPTDKPSVPPTGKRRGPPPGASILSGVKSIDVIDEYTVRLNLSAWDNRILRDLMYSNSSFIVSPTAAKKHSPKWMNTHPVGTGPFMIKKYKRNVHVKYEKFNDYWEKGLPYLDGVEVISIKDPMTAIASLKSGEVHAINEIDRVTASELASDGYYEINGIPGLKISLIANVKDPQSVWSDKRMREAFEYAIDKETIVKTVGRGYSNALYEIMPNPPGNPGTIPRKYNPKKARMLIKDAGHSSGVELKLNIFAETHRDFYIALQQNLAEVGIKVILSPKTRPVIMNLSFKGVRGNDLRMANMVNVTDPLLALESFLSPKAMRFKELKRSPKLIKLLKRVYKEKDPNKQIKLLEQIERLSYNDAMFFPLWTEPLIRAFDPKLKDYIAYYKGYNRLNLVNAWFKKR